MTKVTEKDIQKKYGLPSIVKFFKICGVPNQRPRIVFDDDGVHSFVDRPANKNHVLASYICGGEFIPAEVLKEYVMGCQFHTEKSGHVGLQILRSFIAQ